MCRIIRLCIAGKGRINKHNGLTYAVGKYVHKAGLEYTIEPIHLFRENNQKPADIMIRNFDNGKAAAFDIGITNVLSQGNIIKAGTSKLYAANEYFNHKMNKYKNSLHSNNIHTDFDYYPIIFESLR